MNAKYENVSNENIARFIGAYPLSWIVPVAEPADAILMPVILDQTDDGRPARLVGHLPKRSEAARQFLKCQKAVCLMLGANSYVSPHWIQETDWAPTWNFLSMKIECDVELDESLTKDAVEKLVAHQERNETAPWTTENISHRYDKLISAVIGFRAHIRQVTPRFKTGQDENDAVYARLKSALSDHDLHDWMS